MTSHEHKKISIPIIAEDERYLPTYSSKGASGADVRAAIKAPIILHPGESTVLPTGLRFSIPPNYEIQVRPRSGLAAKHLITVVNTPGTIDADYRGVLGVILINHGKEAFEITPGMRIAQIVVAPVVQAEFVQEEKLTATARGAGGFGHTGLN